MKQTRFNKPNSKLDQKAFTLVEVMLYLAIVGLVFLIGINAFAGQSSRVRYTDSMRSLQSYVQTQFSELSSGVMPIDGGCKYVGNTPQIGVGVTTDGSCVQFGKVFLLSTDNPSEILVYDLIAKNPKTVPSFGFNKEVNGSCNTYDLRCLYPTIVNPGNPQVYETLWGIEFTRGIEPRYGLFTNHPSPIVMSAEDSPNHTVDNVRAFGWVRNPESNEYLPIVFGGQPSDDGSDQPATITEISNPNVYRSTENLKAVSGDIPSVALGSEVGSAFCFRASNGAIGMLTIGIAESQTATGLELSERLQFHDCRG